MHLDTSPEITEFRLRAQTWLESNVPQESRPDVPGPDVRAYDAAWQRRQYEGGWAGIDWARLHGGRGLSLVEQIVWYEELVRAGAPTESIFDVALGHAGPTLILRGSEAQQAFHLPRILQGETPWSQGFSEPDSGSDLASLRTRGDVDGECLIINGSKLWTSSGEYSDYGELLIRTDPAAERHRGLTWAIVDMHSPGIDIRPIMSIDGWPHNCEVFYDDVRIPLSNVVGGLNSGWSVAMSTLAAERGTGFLDRRLHQIPFVDELIELATNSGLIKDEAIADRLAEARAAAAAIRSMAYYQASLAKSGLDPGPETTAMRTWFVELQVCTARLAMDILGGEALEWNHWCRHWLSAFSGPIAGGTIDIQRNIIGERVLGLPR